LDQHPVIQIRVCIVYTGDEFALYPLPLQKLGFRLETKPFPPIKTKVELYVRQLLKGEDVKSCN